MTSPEPDPKDIVCVLPPQVIALGEALGPVAKGARQAMARRVRLSGHEFVTFEDLTHHIGVIQQALSHLTPRLDGLMTEVIHKEGAGMAEAGRAAGRLEQVLSEFIDGYQDAKASHAGPEAGEARSLILGVYRHYIREIIDWLDELVQAITIPASVIRKRGIPLADNVTLTVALNMTSPPEMTKIGALVQKAQLQFQHEPAIEAATRFEQPESSGTGILGAIGAMAFGVGIVKAVFGRNHG